MEARRFFCVFSKISPWFLVLVLAGGQGCVSRSTNENEVRVLSYSSLGGKGGFLRAVKEAFESQSGCQLRIETTLGAAQMVALLRDAATRRNFDVLMGVDEITAGRLMPFLSLEDPVARGVSSQILPFLKNRLHPGFIPLDYSALSLIYRVRDFPAKKSVPRFRRDLLNEGLRKKFIVQDPRASSPGQIFAFFMDGAAAPGDLRSRWLTLAPSWDSSYQMFLSGEAPMVWSYLTSLAYHASKGERDLFGFVDFEEGLPVQVEGMSILRQSGDPGARPCVEKWVRHVLKPETLAILAEKQWMFPAYASVPMPGFFQHVPPVRKVFEIETDSRSVDARMQIWEKELFGVSK